mgnify:CR=1 FL=1
MSEQREHELGTDARACKSHTCTPIYLQASKNGSQHFNHVLHILLYGDSITGLATPKQTSDTARRQHILVGNKRKHSAKQPQADAPSAVRTIAHTSCNPNP